MRTVQINRQEAGQRLDKYLAKYLDAAPKSFLYKMLRKKNIKLNGTKAQGNEKLAEGDEVTFYLAEETLHSFQRDKPVDSVKRAKSNRKKPDIVYEDEDILVVNKPVGLLSQRSNRGEESLVEYINAYLAEQAFKDQEEQGIFRAGICNRLDRNTSGLVTAGKSIRGAQWLNALFHDRSIQKYYLCLVHGTLTGSRHMKGYLRKDERTNKVEILGQPQENSVPIETAYEVIKNIELRNGTEPAKSKSASGRSIKAGKETKTSSAKLKSDEISMTLLRVHLITGKSHQIRAHLASIGHPVAGDIKYASDCLFAKNRDAGLAEVKAFMKNYGVHRQLLHAWQLVFPGSTEQPETQPVLPGGTELPEMQPTLPGDKEQPETQPTLPGGTELPEMQPTLPGDKEQPETQPVLPRGTELSVKYHGLRLTGRPPGTFCRVLEELGVSYQELEEKLKPV